ncbi:hypothetical protein C1H46_004648 [Malus baccata]|uniref:Uncharacterized protein n=1 Tax=Malus baccata TaxID=106549 RepID=A0A540NF90_MALBA|nr:hypothetical protein C1H46_004648 [Malus baccata]
MENKTQQSEKTVMVMAFRVDEGNLSIAHGSNLDLGQMTASHLDCRSEAPLDYVDLEFKEWTLRRL